jgi:hypothetical protein
LLMLVKRYTMCCGLFEARVLRPFGPNLPRGGDPARSAMPASFRGPSSLASCCQQANIGRSLFMVPLLFVAINVRDWLGRIDYIEPGRALRERLLP